MTTPKKIDGAAKREPNTSKQPRRICDLLHCRVTTDPYASSLKGNRAKQVRREARQTRARVMLARMLPYEQWATKVPANMFPCGSWQTPREPYDELVRAMQRQIDSPSPISIEIKRDGTVVYDW